MSPQNRFSHALGRCLSLVTAHSAWFTLVVALLIVALANIVVVGVLHAHLSFGAELGLETLIVCVGVAIPVGLTLAILWPELKAIFAIVSNGPSRATPILLRFVSEELRLLGDRIADTRSRGIDLENSMVTPWVRERCFAVTSGPYHGTDVLVPSKFLATYADSVYLRAQADYMRRTSCTTSVRINVSSLTDLEVDLKDNPKASAEYEQWHIDNGVELLYLDNEKARAISRQDGLAGTVDTAIWEGELVLLWEYRDSGETNLRMTLVGESTYRRAMSFLQHAREAAIPFSDLHCNMPDGLAVTR